jgi:hypothetical protein
VPGRRPSAEVRLKRAQLLEYCRAGIDHDRIADELGYKNGGVVRAIYWEEINKRITAAADECLAIQLDRVEAIIQGSYSAARKGDDKAAQTVIKAMGHEAKLLGLYFADGLQERQVQLQERQEDMGVELLRTALRRLGMSDSEAKPILFEALAEVRRNAIETTSKVKKSTKSDN